MADITFRTIVEPKASSATIGHNEPIFLIGSCFADSVGERLQLGLIPCYSNPYGTAYNPTSVCQQLLRIINNEACTADELIYNSGLWHSKYAHSKQSEVDCDTVKHNIDEATRRARQVLSEAQLLIVTFGTAWTYKLIATGETVANCHKLPASNFERTMLTVDEIVTQWTDAIDKLRAYNPKLRIIFTVSPIRHLKDSAHGNQLSKATLLLAIDKLVATSQAEYFPAYEIMMDDLRDYRFYADDMTHPSDAAVGYIFDRFCDTFFNERARSYIAEASKLSMAVGHRPMKIDDRYKLFVDKTIEFMSSIQNKYGIDENNFVFANIARRLCEIETSLTQNG